MKENKLKNDLIKAIAIPLTDNITYKLNNSIRAYENKMITHNELIAEIKKANDVLKLI